MNIISSLSKKEALKFTQCCKLCNSYGDIIKIEKGVNFSKYDVHFGDILLLREAGLVNYGDDLKVVYQARKIKTDKERDAVILNFPTRGLILSKDNSTEIHLNILSLTNSGREMFKIIRPVQLDDYFDDLRDMLIKQKYWVQETRLVYIAQE